MSVLERLTPDEKRELRRARATETPIELGAYVSDGEYKTPKHIQHINAALMRLATGETQHLAVFCPPRHSKSSTINQYFAAWYLATHPTERIILASYESELAREWGRAARRVLESYGAELFGYDVSPTSSAGHRWHLRRAADGYEPGGGMNTAGVNKGITGRGANILCIDDPVKDAAQARSRAYQERTIEWYRGTAYPRLEAGGRVCLVNTRWHMNDLAGKLLYEEGRIEEGGKWEVVELPGIALENDPLGRAPGEALWPAKFPLSELERRKGSMTPMFWEAQYQQRPRPEEGGLFEKDWLRDYYTTYEGGEQVFYLDDSTRPRRYTRGECWVLATMDLAVSIKETADYTCVAVFFVTPDLDLLLVEMRRGRYEAPDQLPLLQEVNAEYQPMTIGIERTGYQLSLVQHGTRAGLPVMELNPKGDKYTRAIPAAQRMRAGKIFLSATLPNYRDITEEILDFPTGRNDDVVDCLSYSVEVVMGTDYGTGEVDMSAMITPDERY